MAAVEADLRQACSVKTPVRGGTEAPPKEEKRKGAQRSPQKHEKKQGKTTTFSTQRCDFQVNRLSNNHVPYEFNNNEPDVRCKMALKRFDVSDLMANSSAILCSKRLASSPLHQDGLQKEQRAGIKASQNFLLEIFKSKSTLVSTSKR